MSKLTFFVAFILVFGFIKLSSFRFSFVIAKIHAVDAVEEKSEVVLAAMRD